MGARLAGAASGGVGCRAIAGGHTVTIRLILFACAFATRSAITGPLARAPHPHHWSVGCAQERGCQTGISPHPALIARTNALPRIQRVSCLLCLGCLCCRAQCDVSGATVAPETPAATLGTHAPVLLHPSEYSTSCVSQSLLCLCASRWHVCACV